MSPSHPILKLTWVEEINATAPPAVKVDSVFFWRRSWPLNRSNGTHPFSSGGWRQLYRSPGLLHGRPARHASGGDGAQSQSGGRSERAGRRNADVLPLQTEPPGRTVLRSADGALQDCGVLLFAADDEGKLHMNHTDMQEHHRRLLIHHTTKKITTNQTLINNLNMGL